MRRITIGIRLAASTLGCQYVYEFFTIHAHFLSMVKVVSKLDAWSRIDYSSLVKYYAGKMKSVESNKEVCTPVNVTCPPDPMLMTE